MTFEGNIDIPGWSQLRIDLIRCTGKPNCKSSREIDDFIAKYDFFIFTLTT